MATYYSNRVKADGSHAKKGGFGVVEDFCRFTVGTALATSDVIKLFTLPAGARIIGVCINSAGTQASNNDSTYQLGDAGDVDRIVFASEGTELRGGQGSTKFKCSPIAAGHQYTADTDINMRISAAGTGQTTGGVITVLIKYYMD